MTSYACKLCVLWVFTSITITYFYDTVMRMQDHKMSSGTQRIVSSLLVMLALSQPSYCKSSVNTVGLFPADANFGRTGKTIRSCLLSAKFILVSVQSLLVLLFWRFLGSILFFCFCATVCSADDWRNDVYFKPINFNGIWTEETMIPSRLKFTLVSFQSV